MSLAISTASLAFLPGRPPLFSLVCGSMFIGLGFCLRLPSDPPLDEVIIYALQSMRGQTLVKILSTVCFGSQFYIFIIQEIEKKLGGSKPHSKRILETFDVVLFTP